MFDHFEFPSKCRILELGCGPADLWVENAHRMSSDWDVILTDLSFRMLRQARRRLRATGRAFQFKVVDAGQRIPMADSSFDVVLANHMLFYVPDRAKTLREIYRLVRPGGRFIATTFGRGHLRELSRLLDGVGESQSDVEVERFSLERGVREVSQLFPAVKVKRYENSLAVSDADSIVEFVLALKRLPATEASLLYSVFRKNWQGREFRMTQEIGMIDARK